MFQNNVEYQGHLKVKVILRYVGEMVLNNVCDCEVNSLTNEKVIGVYASWSDLPHHIFWVPYGRYKTQHWASNHFKRWMHVGIQLLASCSQSRHCYLLWPTNKVVGIILLTWPHNCFDIVGLFLVAHISIRLPCMCTFHCMLVCLLISRNSELGGIHWMATLQLLLSSWRAFARYGIVLLVRYGSTESASVRNTDMVLFCFESTAREYQCSDSAL